MFKYNRVLTSQPQGAVQLDPYWIKRGLVLVFDSGRYYTPFSSGEMTKIGSPKIYPAPGGTVIAFGSTLTGNTTSRLAGKPRLETVKSGWRSYIGRLYAKSYGGGNLGRIWTDEATDAATPSSINAENLYIQGSVSTKYQYSRWASSNFVTQFLSPNSIVFDTWETIGFTHDQTNGQNILPIGYKNGVAEGSWTLVVGNGPTFGAGYTTPQIGNRPSDLARTFDGCIGIQLFFDGYLSANDHATLAKNPWQVFKPRSLILASVVTAQYARPTSDASAGTWTASSGSDLFAMIDETPASDADYISTINASICEVALGSVTDPAVSTGHIVRYRLAADAGGITVRLREGSTTIASWTHAPAPASLTLYEQTLSAGEANAITNYAALKLQFEATE